MLFCDVRKSFITLSHSLEVQNLKEKDAYILKKFYESKNHQKKPINTGG